MALADAVRIFVSSYQEGACCWGGCACRLPPETYRWMTMSDIGRIPIGRILHLTDDERFWMVVAESPRVDSTALSRLAPPPAITAADVEALYQRLDALKAGDTLIISGSVPSALPGDVYECSGWLHDRAYGERRLLRTSFSHGRLHGVCERVLHGARYAACGGGAFGAYAVTKNPVVSGFSRIVRVAGISRSYDLRLYK